MLSSIASKLAKIKEIAIVLLPKQELFMTVQTLFFDGDRCQAQKSYPGSAQHIAATTPEGHPVVIGHNDIAPYTLAKLSFDQIATGKHKMFRANGKWHVASLH